MIERIFLDEFDSLTLEEDHASARELLYEWIINKGNKLFKELRVHRPILKFKSCHPNNPDIESEEKGEGWAYLLTGAPDVEHALRNFSMEPYDRDRGEAFSDSDGFVLSMDNQADHNEVKADLLNALYSDSFEVVLGNSLINAQQRQENTNELDVRKFARDTALSFVQEYFGFYDSVFKSGEHDFSLEQLSGMAYESFIWKIHARHFIPRNQDNNEEFDQSLTAINLISKKVLDAVNVASTRNNNPPVTLIERILDPAVFVLHRDGENAKRLQSRKVANVIGLIQGLVDNVMVSSCLALSWLMHSSNAEKTVALLQKDDGFDGFLERVKIALKHNAPSPFLPRRGLIKELPSYFENQAMFDNSDTSIPVNFLCATGSAMSSSRITRKSLDVRTGIGRHECVKKSNGVQYGDIITARILWYLLKNYQYKAVPKKSLTLKWGWIVTGMKLAWQKR